MAIPQVLSSNRSVRCPLCGSDRLTVRYVDGELYHCYSCRVQFHGNGEIVGRDEPQTVQPRPAPEQDSAIGNSVTIRGTITASQNFSWNGVMDGPVVVPGHRFTLGPAGRVLGNVQGGEIVVMGTVRGNIVATRRVAMSAGANVIGNIRTPSLNIEDGAYFRGRVEME